MSNDRWTTCDRGHQHWGAEGAAGLMLRHTDAAGTVRYLLQLRSKHVHHGGTWGIPGGAIHPGETPLKAAVREFTEETGTLPAGSVFGRIDVDDHGGWAYHTVLADVSRRITTGATAEQQRTAWFTIGELGELDLHPGVTEVISLHSAPRAGRPAAGGGQILLTGKP